MFSFNNFLMLYKFSLEIKRYICKEKKNVFVKMLGSTNCNSKNYNPKSQKTVCKSQICEVWKVRKSYKVWYTVVLKLQICGSPPFGKMS